MLKDIKKIVVPDDFVFNGMLVVEAPTHKIRVKTHRNRFIDWIFEKVYGYADVSSLPDGTEVVKVNRVLYVRDLEKLRETVEYNDSILNDVK